MSIDVDVSELYINQCDMNNNQFPGENHYSNIRNNKFSSNQDHQLQAQAQMSQFFTHQLTPLQPPSAFQIDNEIDAFHGSHKCHRESMDVSNLPKHFNWILPSNALKAFNSRSFFSLQLVHSASFAHNISTTIECQLSTVGREAHINACVNKAFIRFNIPMGLMEQ